MQTCVSMPWPVSSRSSLRRCQDASDRLCEFTSGVAAKNDSTVRTGLFVQSVNAMLDAFAARESVLERHVPETALWLLFLIMLLASGTLGFASGIGNHRPPPLTVLFSLLLVLVTFLVIDLDPQGNATSGFGIDRSALTGSIYDAMVDGRGDGGRAAAETRLEEGGHLAASQFGVSSAHVTFAQDPDMDALTGAGFLERIDHQFHFLNRGYDSYDAFLSDLASRKRKALKKERREALSAGIAIDWLTGKDITERAWDDFFAFYMDTGSRKWGRPYLTRTFFSLLGERLADRVLLVMARRAGRYIGGALNLIGDDALYGRNWGAIEEHPCLHFEACYYQAIDFAISRKLKRVEAGAQGEHKLARGYRPVPTYSAHEFADIRLERAIADYLQRERRHVAATIEAYEDFAPFKKG